MSDLHLELAELEVESLEITSDVDGVGLEDLTIGHGMTEIGASTGTGTCCSCCLVCCSSCCMG